MKRTLAGSAAVTTSIGGGGGGGGGFWVMMVVVVGTLLPWRAQAFVSFPPPLVTLRSMSTEAAPATLHLHSSTTTQLFSTNTPQRKARRDLKKKRRRGDESATNNSDGKSSLGQQDERFWQTSEIRPLIRSEAREQGADYWVDEEALQRYKEQEAARLAARQSGRQVPDEKLWQEVLSPYKQNWIGFISVTIVILAFILKTFPELAENPVIPLPDL